VIAQLRAEVLKVRSTRTTFGLVLGMLGLILLIVILTGLLSSAVGLSTRDDQVGLFATGGVALIFASLAGVLLITSEYSSGTIRSTLAAAPKRPLLLATKVGVTTVLMVVFCEVLSFASFFLGQAILSDGGAPSATLASSGSARAVVLTGLFIALIALMSFGFGLIFRSTAAAIAAFVGVIFVLPLVMHGISESDVHYLPTNILINSIMATVNQGPGGPFAPLSPTVGLVLMTVYAAIALAVGAALFVRRDA